MFNIAKLTDEHKTKIRNAFSNLDRRGINYEDLQTLVTFSGYGKDACNFIDNERSAERFGSNNIIDRFTRVLKDTAQPNNIRALYTNRFKSLYYYDQ